MCLFSIYKKRAMKKLKWHIGQQNVEWKVVYFCYTILYICEFYCNLFSCKVFWEHYNNFPQQREQFQKYRVKQYRVKAYTTLQNMILWNIATKNILLSQRCRKQKGSLQAWPFRNISQPSSRLLWVIPSMHIKLMPG